MTNINQGVYKKHSVVFRQSSKLQRIKQEIFFSLSFIFLFALINKHKEGRDKLSLRKPAYLPIFIQRNIDQET